METYIYHTPVLLQEVLTYLLTAKNGFYIDGTLGGGGHAKAVLEQLEFSGKVIGIDLDDDALAASGKRLAQFGDRAIIVKENFINIKNVLSQLGVKSVQGVLLDLGVSSFQIDLPKKDSVFDPTHRSICGWIVINSWMPDMLSINMTNNRLQIFFGNMAKRKMHGGLQKL